MNRHEKIEQETLKWLKYLKSTVLQSPFGDIYSWVGVYWMEGFIAPDTSSTDLILGSYIGFETPHTRISIQKGLCGRAIRENQTLNIEDVSQNPEYLSCSLETKSEIVIPLRDPSGTPFGELDIDAKILKAFTPQLEEKLNLECDLFSKKIFEIAQKFPKSSSDS